MVRMFSSPRGKWIKVNDTETLESEMRKNVKQVS